MPESTEEASERWPRLKLSDLPIERVHCLVSGTMQETTPEELTARSLAIQQKRHDTAEACRRPLRPTTLRAA